MIGDLLSDARVSVRRLLRQKVLMLAVVSLSVVGFGSTIALSSVLTSVYRHPLPYPQVDRIGILLRQRPEGATTSFAFATIDRVRSASQATAVAALSSTRGMTLVRQERAAFLRTIRVTPSYFDVLGVLPLYGSGFATASQPLQPDNVILTDRAWSTFFARNPGIVGTRILIDAAPHTVVGIMPPSFRSFPEVDAYLPLTAQTESGGRNYTVLVRLQPSVEMTAASEAIRAAQVLAGEPTAEQDAVELIPYQRQLVGRLRDHVVLFTAGTSLLFIATCASTMCLLLGWCSTRLPEYATRLALGASRARLSREALLDTGLMLFPAVIGGGIVARLGLTLLPQFGSEWANWNIRPDETVVLATAITAVLIGLAAGVLPLIVSTTGFASGTWRNTVGVQSGRLSTAWTGRTLTAVQVGISVALLIPAAVVADSLRRIQRTELGFEPSGVLTAQIALGATEHESAAEVAAFYERLLATIKALPDVEAAAVVSGVPAERGFNAPLSLHGSTGTVADWRYVSGDYFSVMNIPSVAGAVQQVGASERSIIVNEAFVKRHLGGNWEPGRYVSLYGTDQPYQIGGVVHDTAGAAPSLQSRPTVFVPVRMAPDALVDLTHRFFSPSIVLRHRGQSGSLSLALENALAQVDRNACFSSIRPMDDVVRSALLLPQFGAYVFLAFGGVALMTLAIGVYGLRYFAVRNRLRELSIRTAIGAPYSSFVKGAIAEGLAVATVGGVAGIAGGMALSRALAAVTTSPGELQPSIYGFVLTVVIFVACAASVIPTRQVRSDRVMLLLRPD